MGSPEDKLNNPYYKSPYARPTYPSMEGGFIPLSFSSPCKPEMGQGNNRQRGGMTTPARTYNQQNWHNNYRKNRGFSSQPKDFNYFTNRASSAGDWQPQNQNSERKFHKKLTWSSDINDYIHPTTFQDPWKELIDRQHALGSYDLEAEQAANNLAGEGTSEQEEQAADKTSCDLEDQSVDKSADESACTFMEEAAEKSDGEDISGGSINKDK